MLLLQIFFLLHLLDALFFIREKKYIAWIHRGKGDSDYGYDCAKNVAFLQTKTPWTCVCCCIRSLILSDNVTRVTDFMATQVLASMFTINLNLTVHI